MGTNNKWDRRRKEKTDFSKRWLLKKKKKNYGGTCKIEEQ